MVKETQNLKERLHRFSYRTPLCVEYPAHTIAAGCIYLASMLLKEGDELFRGLANDQPWDQLFCSRMEDIEGESGTPHDAEYYTSFKIRINEQALERGTDPNMDEFTREELTTQVTDWQFDGTSSPLYAVNTNQHTATYELG
ncbi:hypothetical protein BX666DRAFT_1874603 [Dichotomocladium elegans]|nr:hypothetical protein BX666DRAFT_1874603 [Dichotomocladium elegans]